MPSTKAERSCDRGHTSVVLSSKIYRPLSIHRPWNMRSHNRAILLLDLPWSYSLLTNTKNNLSWWYVYKCSNLCCGIQRQCRCLCLLVWSGNDITTQMKLSMYLNNYQLIRLDGDTRSVVLNLLKASPLEIRKQLDT